MSIVRHDVHMLKTRTAAMEAVRLRNELQANRTYSADLIYRSCFEGDLRKQFG